MADTETRGMGDTGGKRVSQDSAFNGPRKIDQGDVITCCGECSVNTYCPLREFAATIPAGCELEHAPEPTE